MAKPKKKKKGILGGPFKIPHVQGPIKRGSGYPKGFIGKITGRGSK